MWSSRLLAYEGNTCNGGQEREKVDASLSNFGNSENLMAHYYDQNSEICSQGILRNTTYKLSVQLILKKNKCWNMH